MSHRCDKNCGLESCRPLLRSMTPIRRTETARADILEIGDYIAVRSPLAAERFIAEIPERVTALSDQPRPGRIVQELDRSDIRELLHGNYRIVYRLVGNEAQILTVFEGHRLFDGE